ncbi:hypothetical protein [Polymorphobacter sp.]|uniref:hypothetical protein n=1 Tax=Polymorphobacter sp. TaxID=1909290 RepID=UPI003F727920
MAGGHFQRGRISYRDANGETGREWFEMVRHAHGRTLRAFCEMDDMDLSRDVTIALDAQSRPVDAFVRVIRGGAVVGSTLFLLGEDRLECLGDIAGPGRIAQRIALDRPLAYLGLHPLVGDALIATARGTGDEGDYIPVNCYANSQAAAGDEGLYAMPVTIDVAYLGTEDLAVEAGTFTARRYALRWKPDWEPALLWVHGDEALFLRLEWPMIGARYELVEHQIGRE